MLPDDQPKVPTRSPDPSRSSPPGVWVAPTVEELQAKLPQYEVLEILGRGGMGAVYKARQKSLKRLVAIKILARDGGDDEMRFGERFQHEALAMARLNHPNIVNVYDAGEAADGLLYFVMEHVEGRDLAQVIAQRGRLPQAEVRAIALQVAEALAYAHANGIVHRDIKPANILVTERGEVKVADFGLAKASEPLVSTLLTKSGTSMGTADFMAPETRKTGVADARSDVFSLGVTLYQLLTGELPQGMFKLPSELHPELDTRWDEIICKALEPKPADRYQSVEALKHDLARIGEAEAVVKKEPQQQTSKQPAWLAYALVAMVLLIAGAAWIVMLPKQPPAVSATAFDLATFTKEMAAADVETKWTLFKNKLDELNDSDVTILRNVEDKQRGRVTYLGISNNARPLKDIRPVAAVPEVVSLFFHDVWLEDISCLKGMKLEQLGIFQSKITDLSVLETLPSLWSLNLANATGIRDFTPLRKLKLGVLFLNTNPQLKDISFVKGMPVRILNIRDTGVRDLSPLAGMGIEELECNADIPMTAELLRSLPKLKMINGKPVEVWQQKTGGKVAIGSEGKVIDLMPLIDVQRDAIAGEWRMDNGRLVASKAGEGPGTGFPRLELPYAPPAEYEFEVEFEVAGEGSGICQILSAKGRSFSWVVGAQMAAGWKTGFETIEGQTVLSRLDGTMLRSADFLQSGRRHSMKVEVRSTTLRGYLDDRQLIHWGKSVEAFQLLDISPRLALRKPGRLGLAANNRAVTFHRVMVREITGEGSKEGVSAGAAAWTDWLTAKLRAGELISSGWIQEKEGITTDAAIRGVNMIPYHLSDCAARLTYDLRNSEGIQITLRERKGTANERELYVADDTGRSLYIGRMLPDRSVAKLVNKDYAADPSMKGPRVLEFRCEGNRLTATLKGATKDDLTVTAVDGVLDKGPCALVMKKGALLKKAEVLELQAQSAPTSPIR